MPQGVVRPLNHSELRVRMPAPAYRLLGIRLATRRAAGDMAHRLLAKFDGDGLAKCETVAGDRALLRHVPQ
jgi:hypothetical protein